MQRFVLLVAFVVVNLVSLFTAQVTAQVTPIPQPAPLPPAPPESAPAPVPVGEPAPAQPAPAQPAPAPAPTPSPVAPPAAPFQPESSAVEAVETPPASEPALQGGDDENWQTPSDHDRVTGRVGIGFMGVHGVPYGAPGSDGQVDAPTIGVRYWLDDSLAIEVGVGMGFNLSSGTAFAPNIADQDTAETGEFAFLLHGGLPISVWDVGHYNAIVVPELNIGFSNGIDDPVPTGPNDDTFFNGLLVNVGVRAGAELHLEFLGIPQATVQLTVGAGLSMERRMTENDAQQGTDRTTFSIGTNIASLSDLVSSGLQLFFYF